MGTDIERAVLEKDGFAIYRELLDASKIDALVAESNRLFGAERDGARRRGGVRAPVRASAYVAQTASCEPVQSLSRQAIGDGAFLVRSILFDKSPEANWDVPWHRDTTIAVHDRRDVPGFGPWSLKDGTPHVRPPVEILERMITLRIHLDPCPASNGALLVVPGSHRNVNLARESVDAAWCADRAIACEVDVGDCVVMRPLILHASRKAEIASHRRVLHLEFAAERLPGELEWAKP